jgi:hypothetical protein
MLTFRGIGNSALRKDGAKPISIPDVFRKFVALIVFSFVSALAESWFAYAMYDHLVEHTRIAISGTPVQLPPAERPPWFGYESPFGSPEFLAELLVLALAEVFRQGLALQRDSDLTV